MARPNEIVCRVYLWPVRWATIRQSFSRRPTSSILPIKCYIFTFKFSMNLLLAISFEKARPIYIWVVAVVRPERTDSHVDARITALVVPTVVIN